MEVKELLPYYKKINKFLYDKDYESINKIFNELTIEKEPSTLLVGLLRLTYTYKTRISFWIPLRDKVEKEFESRGLDSESILKGLLINE